MACFDEDVAGYRREAWVTRAGDGAGYSARVVVRRLPALGVVFEDATRADDGPWESPQQALAAALERGRQVVRREAMGQVMRAAGGPSAPDEV